MYINEEKKLCFLAHPRAASRAVRDFLLPRGFEGLGAHHDGPDQGYDLSPYQCFCIVRNHWDAMVSWWFNARMNDMEDVPSMRWLAHYISHNHAYFRPGELWWFIKSVPNIKVLRYEMLETDLSLFLAKYDIGPVSLSVVGESKPRQRRHYSYYLKSDTARFIRWAFEPEILMLRYRYEEIPGVH